MRSAGGPTIGSVVKFISFIYSGYYYLFADLKLSRKPNFSAWASCTLATIFYAFSILIIVGKLYNDRSNDSNFPFGGIAIMTAITIGLLSDWNIRHTWFGATTIEMRKRQRTFAKAVSLALLIGSWLVFISVGLTLYT